MHPATLRKKVRQAEADSGARRDGASISRSLTRRRPAAPGAGVDPAQQHVTVRQTVFLAAAHSFARDIRLLSRAAGDDRRGAAGTVVGSGLDG